MNKATKFIAISALLSLSTAAQATITPSSAGAIDGYQNNDQLNPLTVNTSPDGTFGYTDWVFYNKFDFDDDGVTGVYTNNNVFSVTSNGTDSFREAGNWSLDANIWDSADDVLFVLKGGGGNIDPDVYQAYLLTGNSVDGAGNLVNTLNPLPVSGTYETPFANGNNGNPGAISHFSVYVRGNGSGGSGGGGNPPVPEPSTYAMFATAFAILGFAGYRSRNRKS